MEAAERRAWLRTWPEAADIVHHVYYQLNLGAQCSQALLVRDQITFKQSGLAFTFAAPFYVCPSPVRMRKQRNAKFYSHINAVLRHDDTPRVHDEVANDHQSACPSSTRKTASTSPLAGETSSSNKRSSSANYSTSGCHCSDSLSL